MTNPGAGLWVDPGHLLELANKQSDVAADIAAATALVADEAGAITRTHGPVCFATSSAAAAAASARANACAVMQTTSEAYAANLENAAAKYSLTDQQSGREIDGEMRPRFS